jgi:hypothetical protein
MKSRIAVMQTGEGRESEGAEAVDEHSEEGAINPDVLRHKDVSIGGPGVLVT